ncbi:MAG: phosphate signaling complex protein PhoU [Chloroflexi bacterium]|nr:phosphate signaling complex protein PhoU [Chloroflexota bacterium]
MLRRRFEGELKRLQDEVLGLGYAVQRAITEAVDGLKVRNLDVSQQIIAGDSEINRKRFQIEADVLVLIATQQPMARDLRALAAILDIIRELERTGDYAKGIAKISLNIGEEELIKPLLDIPRMSEKAMDMLGRALRAYIDNDDRSAREIALEDDEVDGLYNQVRHELVTLILADPSRVEQANMLLWAAHNLERAADRVTNICERVVFSATGELGELPNSPDQSDA